MKPEIWVVDDSPLQAEANRRALESDFTVRVFEGGTAMLETLAFGAPPKLVVLDWHMPDVSGADVCRFVRRVHNSAQLPILILTASGSEDNLLEGLAAGANDFVRKPFAVTELRARVAALIRAAADHARLADAERQLRIEADFRERFMGMLAHDLRQPLNAIFMANTLLSAKHEDSATAASAMLQLRAAERMKRMIAELLDFTRIRPETGMPIQKQSIDLATAARSMVEELRASHPTRVLHFDADGPCQGQWDPDRIAQVCSNLICNAIEHSDVSSEIFVRLECGEGNSVRLRIANEGQRLSQDTLDQLFLPFRRGTAKSAGGLGLGLYIVHQIVTAHGGSVKAESEDGRTEFIVELPVQGSANG
jgi:two-component system sensor histidine kinase/response regulator